MIDRAFAGLGVAKKVKNIWKKPAGNPSRAKRFIEDVVIAKFNRRSVAFATAYPELAAEWYYPKNCGWHPEDFASRSHVVAWFKCSDCHYIWQTTIKSRTLLGSGCHNFNLGETTDLRDYPNALSQFDVRKNKGIDPHMLPRMQKVWWRCEKAKDHRWVSAFNRKDSERCPYCRGIKASSTNNLTQLPKFAKQFHPTKNGKLKACDVTIGTRDIYWWKCAAGPDHEWQVSVSDRVAYDTDCPFCTNRRPSVTNCLLTTYPLVAKEWHRTKNKPLKADQLTPGSNKRVWWQCVKCKHEWQTKVQQRTSRGQGCPACAGKVFSKEKSLAFLFPKIAKEWHPERNGGKRPADVHAGTNVKYWFLCKTCGGEWQARINSRTRGMGACPCKKQRRRLSSSVK